MGKRPIGVMAYSGLLIIAAIYFSTFVIGEVSRESFANIVVLVITLFFMIHTAIYLWRLEEKGRSGMIAISLIFLGVGALCTIPSFVLVKGMNTLIVGSLFVLPSLIALIYFTRPEVKELFK